MRIWSFHPRYLDKQGLLSLWRETLLAKKVLEEKTKGYKNHPQLTRFKRTKNPIDCINQYLAAVYQESVKREYKFNRNKIKWNFNPVKLIVKSGQLNYEIKHFLKKLKMRDIDKYNNLTRKTEFEPHPLFKVVEGEIEEWETVIDKKSAQG
jgi:hypothetical protein